MSANSINRKEIRDAFATLCDAAMTGTAVEAVYGRSVGDFEGKSPVLIVTSRGGGMERVQKVGQGKYAVWVYLTAFTFVIYSDAASGWTEADAEDALDTVEKELADVLQDNIGRAAGGSWDKAEFVGKTTVDGVNIGGHDYLRETISLRFQIISG